MPRNWRTRIELRREKDREQADRGVRRQRSGKKDEDRRNEEGGGVDQSERVKFEDGREM